MSACIHEPGTCPACDGPDDTHWTDITEHVRSISLIGGPDLPVTGMWIGPPTEAVLPSDGTDWMYAGDLDDPLGFDPDDGPTQFMGLPSITRPVDITWDPLALALWLLAPHLAADPRYQPNGARP